MKGLPVTEADRAAAETIGYPNPMQALCLPGHAVTVTRVATPAYDGWVCECGCGRTSAGGRLSAALARLVDVEVAEVTVGAA